MWETLTMKTFWKDLDSLIETVDRGVAVLRDRETEDTEKFSLSVDVPGFDPAAIKVEVKDRKLTISGKDKVRGDLFRSYLLPESVDEAAVSASCANGVLTVVLPKAKVKTGRTVEVKVSP